MEEISQAVLPNGIKLIYRQRQGAVSHLTLMANTGMRDELENENGLAHCVEHMVFKGTKKRKAFYVLSCLENVGGDLNAFTTKEETCIHASFLKEHYLKAMDLFSDVAFNSTFPVHELEKEKEVILDEINSYRDTPSEEIYDEFENLIYKGHQLGRNILGTASLVGNYTRDDIVGFIKKNYATDRMILASVSDMPFEQFYQYALKYFGDYQRFKTSFHREPFTAIPTQTVIEERNNHLTHCMIGGLAYHYDHPKKLGLILLNNILGGPGMNSRLSLNIREKYGFAYTIESQYNAYSDTGNFSVYAGVDPRSLDKSIELIFKELNKLMNNKLGTMQLYHAKNQLIGQVALSNESGMNELLSIARAGFSQEGVETMAQAIEKIDKITADDLLEIANEIFDRNMMNLLIYKGVEEK